MSPPVQQRNAKREAATFAYRFGAPIALIIAAVTTLSEMVDALKPIVPESWKLPLTIGGIVLGVLGRSTLRDAVEPNRRGARGAGRAGTPRKRGAAGKFVAEPAEPPRTREPRKAATTRDESRPDIPSRPLRPLVRDTSADTLNADERAQLRRLLAAIGQSGAAPSPAPEGSE